jgi:hypothetical protein
MNAASHLVSLVLATTLPGPRLRPTGVFALADPGINFHL